MAATKAYAELTGPKTGGIERDQMRPCWYRIALTLAGLDSVQWSGPYRDKTDAENAAHEEAKRRNLCLEWCG